jgi:hypothetical protein
MMSIKLITSVVSSYIDYYWCDGLWCPQVEVQCNRSCYYGNSHKQTQMADNRGFETWLASV